MAPLYDGIALIGVNAASAYEWQQFSQLSPYVTGGTVVRRLLNSLTEGPSHLLPDLALDRLTNPKYGPRNITDDLINLDNFQASAQWCYDRRYFFDGGVIISQDSPRQWIAEHAAFMLLDFREVNGRYDLVPQITFGVVSHAALFTAGNIAEGTFKFETIALEDRQPSQISVKWRQERSSTNPANRACSRQSGRCWCGRRRLMAATRCRSRRSISKGSAPTKTTPSMRQDSRSGCAGCGIMRSALRPPTTDWRASPRALGLST